MTEQQELALYRVVFSLPHHQRRMALARKIIEQGGPLTPDYKEYRTSLRLCNQMLDDPRLGEVLDGTGERKEGRETAQAPRQ